MFLKFYQVLSGIYKNYRSEQYNKIVYYEPEYINIDSVGKSANKVELGLLNLDTIIEQFISNENLAEVMSWDECGRRFIQIQFVNISNHLKKNYPICTELFNDKSESFISGPKIENSYCVHATHKYLNLFIKKTFEKLVLYCNLEVLTFKEKTLQKNYR